MATKRALLAATGMLVLACSKPAGTGKDSSSEAGRDSGGGAAKWDGAAGTGGVSDAAPGKDGVANGTDASAVKDAAANADTRPASFTCENGGYCPTSGQSCTDGVGRSCLCVGPPSASYLACDNGGAAGAGGSGGGAGSGAAGTAGGAGSGGTGGSAGTVGGTAGGAGSGGTGGSVGGSVGGTASLGVACTGSAPWTTGTTADTRIVVDASQKGGAWNRFYERGVAACHANTVLATAYGRNIQAALKKGHDLAGFQYARFHGILDSDIGVYKETNGVASYDWTRFDAVYDAVIAAGMRPVVEVSFMPPPLAMTSDPQASTVKPDLHWYNGAPANIMPPKNWNAWMDLMAALVTHVEARYGADEVRKNWYFEIWNEASWMYSRGMGGYNELFGYTARGLYKGDPLVRVGGPAESAGGSPWGIRNLVSYCNTNKLKLDFVSYHQYGQDDTGTARVSMATSIHASIIDAVKAASFTGEVLNTEWGSTYSAHVARDSEISASYVAKAVHLLGTNASVPAPSMFAYWTISDLYEEFDTGSNTAFREGNYGLLLKGDPRYPESFDVAKPAFNAFRLLHMMGATRLQTSGGTTSDGVNAVATLGADGSSVQILVYNHVDGGGASSSATKQVSVTVSNLPFTPSRLRHYVVDRTHSNSYTAWTSMGKPRQPSQSQWGQLRDAGELCYFPGTASGTTWSATFPQNTYSVSLIVLEK